MWTPSVAKDRKMQRVGFGMDVHRLAHGETLFLGGILVPSDLGTVAHSDGDVLLHAICDALLGAAKLGDIGSNFPDTSEEFKNIDSKILLARTCRMITDRGWRIVNVDATLCLQHPKIRPFIAAMEEGMAGIMAITADQVSVKATTTEHLGYEGRREGVTAYAVVLLEKSE